MQGEAHADIHTLTGASRLDNIRQAITPVLARHALNLLAWEQLSQVLQLQQSPCQRHKQQLLAENQNDTVMGVQVTWLFNALFWSQKHAFDCYFAWPNP